VAVVGSNLRADGTVYVGIGVGVEARGQNRWRFETGAIVNSSPALGDDGTVFVGSDDGRCMPCKAAAAWR